MPYTASGPTVVHQQKAVVETIDPDDITITTIDESEEPEIAITTINESGENMEMLEELDEDDEEDDDHEDDLLLLEEDHSVVSKKKWRKTCWECQKTFSSGTLCSEHEKIVRLGIADRACTYEGCKFKTARHTLSLIHI